MKKLWKKYDVEIVMLFMIIISVSYLLFLQQKVIDDMRKQHNELIELIENDVDVCR